MAVVMEAGEVGAVEVRKIISGFWQKNVMYEFGIKNMTTFVLK